MQISHLTNPDSSAFYPILRASLPVGRPLAAGETIKCELLKPVGYQGDVVVDIVDSPEFGTNWESSDPNDWSRFPARVRAAATALRDSGNHGRFRITHKKGSLCISTFVGVSPPAKVSKNPPWNREELLLALELYIQNRKSPPSKSSKEVESLSKELNQLRACIGGPSAESLRNAAGVYLKMMNFRSYDPDYISQGKVGMRHGNKLEPAIWSEFYGKENELFMACRAIREALKELPKDSSDYSESDGFSEAAEGRLLTRFHRLRERSVKLVSAKKKWAMKKFGSLTCEACGFNFAKIYGKRGHGFIECHHKKPVHELGDGHKTNTDDLALLCSNCHRMIHTQRPWLSVDELKALCSECAPAN